MRADVEPAEIVGIEHLAQRIAVRPFGAGPVSVLERQAGGLPLFFFRPQEGGNLFGRYGYDKFKRSIGFISKFDGAGARLEQVKSVPVHAQGPAARLKQSEFGGKGVCARFAGGQR